MVDIVALPAVIANVINRSRKITPAHEGRGSSLPPLLSQPQRQQQVRFFWHQPNNVEVNAPATAEPGCEDGIMRGGDGRRIDVVVIVSRGSIQAANGNAELPTYHHRILPLDPFCAFTTFSLAIKRQGLMKQPLLVVLSSYINFFASVLHLILIDFELES
jgi:hypothetical protein